MSLKLRPTQLWRFLLSNGVLQVQSAVVRPSLTEMQVILTKSFLGGHWSDPEFAENDFSTFTFRTFTLLNL